MANPTTNFGWVMPTPTDLVTDLPADFEVFGQAVDTAFQYLKGGTTGQILSKTSNTDLAYTWINNDTGDITGVTAGTGLTGGGTSGTVSLAFDQANFGGAQSAVKNKIINGNLDIAQRGTSFTSVASGTYTLDRWRTVTSATTLNTTITQDTSVPNGVSKYSLKVLQASTTSGVGEYCVRQPIETQNVMPMAGSTVTVSFWYRSNVTTNSHAVRLQSSLTGGTDQALAFTVSAANTWEKKILTFSTFAGVTAASTAYNAEGAILDIGFNVFGSASRSSLTANDYFQFTQMQLEIGSTNTIFSRTAGTIQGELAACQRYYYRLTPGATYNVFGSGFSNSTTVFLATIPTPVNMRIAPTALEQSGTASQYSVFQGSSGLTCNSVPALYHGNTNQQVVSFGVASGLTIGQAGIARTDNNTTAYLGWTAEL